MHVEPIDDPSEFLERAGPLLLEDEARHNLILGIAGTLHDNPAAYEEHRLWIVVDHDEPVGAALQTPPFNVVVAQPTDPDALARLAHALDADDVDLPGVTAAVPEVDAFAEAWQTCSGRSPQRRMAQRVYRATEVRPPRGVSGTSRAATVQDRDLLVSWVRAFGDEALRGLDSPAGEPERIVDTRLAGEAGGFVLWEEKGEPVSIAGWGSRTPNGVRIGPVYTPPARRRRGYGSAVTAAVSAEHLASGRRFCFLYTDLANATSNRIYGDIGYEPVCDSVVYTFEPR